MSSRDKFSYHLSRLACHGLAAFLVACFLVSSSYSQDIDRGQPFGISANPGQYKGYLDWASKQQFTAEGIPASIVDAYWKCVHPASYRVMDEAERDTVDDAASGNGMPEIEFRVFLARVEARVGSTGKYWALVLNQCKEQFGDYWNYIRKHAQE